MATPTGRSISGFCWSAGVSSNRPRRHTGERLSVAFPQAACNLGVLLAEQGDLVGAESAFRQADQAGDAPAAFNLAVLLETQDNLAAAREAFARAAERGTPELAQTAGAALRELDKRIALSAGQGGGHGGR